METNQKETGQTTENKILAAAEEEFFLKGYAGARTMAIAERAGVTHAMLHYYFRTKEHLFDRIIENKIGTIRDIMLTSVDDASVPLFAKIETAVSRHIDFLAANPGLPKFMVCEVFGNPERLSAVTDKIARAAPRAVNSLQRQIDECAAKGLCRRVDASMLVLDIVSLNMFSFIAGPVVNILLGGGLDDMTAFVKRRKKENIETIMRKLKP